MLEKVTGTFRFEVTGSGPSPGRRREEGRRHRLARQRKADAVVRADRKVFDAIASGEMNALAATLRGAAVIQGDLGLLAGFQRLFPGPPGQSRRRGPPS